MCTNELIVLQFLGIHRDSNSRPNFRKGFEVIIPTEPPGRPACVIKTFRWGLLVHATKLCPFARAYGKYGNRNYAH